MPKPSAVDRNEPSLTLRLRDEHLAAQTDTRVLITANTAAAIETIARRIHTASARREQPFVQLSGGELPDDRGTLKTTWFRLLDAAAGGTLLVTNVEAMPHAVQLEMIERLEQTRRRRTPVRLLTGTTSSLRDRVAAGLFDERLFYCLNVVHLVEEGHA